MDPRVRGSVFSSGSSNTNNSNNNTNVYSGGYNGNGRGSSPQERERSYLELQRESKIMELTEALSYAQTRARKADRTVEEYDDVINAAINEVLISLQQIEADLFTITTEGQNLEEEIQRRENQNEGSEEYLSIGWTDSLMEGLEEVRMQQYNLETQYEANKAVLAKFQQIVSSLLQFRSQHDPEGLLKTKLLENADEELKQQIFAEFENTRFTKSSSFSSKQQEDEEKQQVQQQSKITELTNQFETKLQQTISDLRQMETRYNSRIQQLSNELDSEKRIRAQVEEALYSYKQEQEQQQYSNHSEFQVEPIEIIQSSSSSSPNPHLNKYPHSHPHSNSNIVDSHNIITDSNNTNTHPLGVVTWMWGVIEYLLKGVALSPDSTSSPKGTPIYFFHG